MNLIENELMKRSISSCSQWIEQIRLNDSARAMSFSLNVRISY